MAFTEPERVKIRRYMGWPPGKTEPKYDSQIQYIQSTSEGGVMPDSSTEAEARAILGDLAIVEAQLKQLWERPDAHTLDKGDVRTDMPRGRAMLLMEGRRLVRNLAIILNATPLTDAFLSSAR